MKALQIRFSLFILLILRGGSFIQAQTPPMQGTIQITILDESSKPLEGANVNLLNPKDSSLAKANITDAQGLAALENVKFGEYLISVSSLGFKTHLSGGINLNTVALTVPPIRLEKEEKTLAEVTVVSKKQFIERKLDRIVVNVEGSILSAGSSAMEVLERAPSVNVNQNDVISLRGKTGVIVMIDGKPTPLSGADLANYLRTLPSSSVERMDIITNPSAKYDAAGNSGIIDIRLKKDKRFGTNGSATANYGQGVYPKAGAGLSLNYRNSKMNVFGNYNYSYRVGLNHLLLDRNFYTDNGTYNGGDLKDNYMRMPNIGNTGRLGMDFFPSPKTIIGFVVNTDFFNFRRNANNYSEILAPNRQKISTFSAVATNNDHSRNNVANINFKHTIDSTGKELSADLDYGTYNSNSLTRNATNYRKLDGSILQPDYILEGDQKGDLSFKTAKVDYVHPLSKMGKFEVGGKISFVNADNDAQFNDVSTGKPINDVNKTNRFLYAENINAGYLNWSKEFKKMDIQLGLRGENTALETEQLVGNRQFDTSYFQLFPSAFFNFKLKNEQTLGLSVSRRIDRPSFNSLNPFLFLIDVTTFATGRPTLLPQLTWSYEMTYSVKNMNFTLNYSRTKQNMDIAIAKFRDVFPLIPSDDNVTVQIPINIASADYIGLSSSLPLQVTKWWNSTLNLDAYYQHFNGKLGITTLDRGITAIDLRINNAFTLKNGWAAELNGSYNSPQQSGFMRLDPLWGINLGVQKNLWQNKATLKLSASDIFWTNLPRAVITYDNYIEKWKAFRETRVASVAFTYRFGNNKVAQARRRALGSEDEKRRAGQ
jgi:iron complex outermembrane recepter protein